MGWFAAQHAADHGPKLFGGQADVEVEEGVAHDLVGSDAPQVGGAVVPDLNIEVSVEDRSAELDVAQDGVKKHVEAVHNLGALPQVCVDPLELGVAGFELFVHGLDLLPRTLEVVSKS